MVRGDASKPLRHSLTQQGAISQRLEELTEVGCGGEGTQLLLEAREKRGVFKCFNGSYWLPTLFNLHGRAIPWTELAVFMAYSVAVCAISTQIPATQKEESTSQLRQLGQVTSTIGILLFLLVTFRNNAAFNRWQSGSDRFNAFCDKSRNLARLTAGNLPQYMGINKQAAHRHALCNIRWLMAAVEVARQTLRGVRNEQSLAHLIDDDEDMQALMEAEDQVLYCLLRVQTHERSFRLEKDQKWFERADDTYLDFAGCRAVLCTPIPFAYIAHLRTFMLLWLATIPWVYVVYFDWYTLLLCAVIGYGVIGVEEAAVEVEQPFGTDFNDLPLDSIVASTHRAMGGVMKFIRQQKRLAIAAGEIEPEEEAEGADTPPQLAGLQGVKVESPLESPLK